MAPLRRRARRREDAGDAAPSAPSEPNERCADATAPVCAPAAHHLPNLESGASRRRCGGGGAMHPPAAASFLGESASSTPPVGGGPIDAGGWKIASPVHAGVSHGPASALQELPSPAEIGPILVTMVEERPLWLVGVVFMVLGSLSSATGMLYLKRASLGPNPPPWWRNVYFYAGLFMLIGNASLLDVVAFAITPLSLIAPFAGMTIVFTLLLAACGCVGVHERPPRDAMTAIALVVTGVTAAAIFGPHSDESLRPAELQCHLEAHPLLLYGAMSGLPALALFRLGAFFRPEKADAVMASPVGALALAMLGAIYGSMVQLLFKTVATGLFDYVQARANHPHAVRAPRQSPAPPRPLTAAFSFSRAVVDIAVPVAPRRDAPARRDRVVRHRPARIPQHRHHLIARHLRGKRRTPHPPCPPSLRAPEIPQPSLGVTSDRSRRCRRTNQRSCCSPSASPARSSTSSLCSRRCAWRCSRSDAL